MSDWFARRARLAAQLPAGAVAVLATAPERRRNGDSDYPYRHDSSFYYLCGFPEPEAVLVIVAGQRPRSLLFCREKNAEREIWDGFRYGPEAAQTAFGVDEAYPIDDLDVHLAELLADAPALYLPLARDAALDARARGWLDSVRAQARKGVQAPAVLGDLTPLVEEMRLIKDAGELATMEQAGRISAQAHARAMRAVRPGMPEYALEAELLYEFRRHGAQAPAYPSIVAGGANACVLHYVANNALLRDGDLVLIDAGCELDGYASDITRTFPVNGRFSPAQRDLYELVLAAQAAAIATIAPGRRVAEVHEAALRVLTQGMLDLGLITHLVSLEQALEQRLYLPFYMHGTSHWLGMDVHDCGNYKDVHHSERPSRLLETGMVLTVEPGIYVRAAEGVPREFWNTGIRIEDDAAVTAHGARLLSAGAPKTVREIEDLMQHD
ncbi:aminopeptidase P N-terminal domain-containing protein [Massilia sp. TS11]|uniref:aminopeptidase P N-terminal domain-containing protein n=1 Tax=Massilia sp. TS11 TaxID=2908003 RepID=UPI001EDC8000|nr:aminopeptidase P N-terminal domain-containing protein [Massilia sp. TS11]MCG2586716.1 aminopeptidase P N-terminal domain-containing protein [Massilia sp. TS11]